MVIELVEMTISTKYSGFDKLNHRFSYLLDSPFALRTSAAAPLPAATDGAPIANTGDNFAQNSFHLSREYLPLTDG
jgi:hypothetical protein